MENDIKFSNECVMSEKEINLLKPILQMRIDSLVHSGTPVESLASDLSSYMVHLTPGLGISKAMDVYSEVLEKVIQDDSSLKTSISKDYPYILNAYVLDWEIRNGNQGMIREYIKENGVILDFDKLLNEKYTHFMKESLEFLRYNRILAVLNNDMQMGRNTENVKKFKELFKKH
jgi:hypothetical protein